MDEIKKVSGHKFNISSWILKSCQLHTVTAGQTTHSKLFRTNFKTQVTEPQVKSWITVLDSVNSKCNQVKNGQ